MSQYKSQIQNMFLSQARKKHQKVELVLETGTVLRGKLKAYDQFSVTLGFKDQSEVIYKSSIIYMTILPSMHTPGFDKRSRYDYQDDEFRRDAGYHRSNDFYDDDDESDYEANTRALNSYKKIGDDNSPSNSYSNRYDNGYRRSNNENNYRRDYSNRRDSSEGYNRDGGYRKYDNDRYKRDGGDNYRRDGGNRRYNNENRPNNGYSSPFNTRRNDEYNKPVNQTRRPYSRRSDDDDDPPPPKKVIVRRY